MPGRRLAATVAAVGFLVIAAFQVALALGAPLGRAAWGGANRVVPPRLRRASAVAVVIWLLAAVLILVAGGVVGVPLPRVVLDDRGVGAGGALGARGAGEPRVVEPVGAVRLGARCAAVLAVLSFVVASSPT